MSREKELKESLDRLIDCIDTLRTAEMLQDEVDVLQRSEQLIHQLERSREVLEDKPCNCGKYSYPHRRGHG